MRTPAVAVIALWSLTSLAATSSAQDWPQWRGSSRDGSVAAAAVPATWPAAVTPAWRIEVGEGYSSPIVAGNRVFVHRWDGRSRCPGAIAARLEVASTSGVRRSALRVRPG